MDEDLLHQMAKKVLLLWVRSGGHDLLEVVHKAREHLPIEGGEVKALAPLLQIMLLVLELFDPGVEIVDLLRARLGLHRLSLPRRKGWGEPKAGARHETA